MSLQAEKYGGIIFCGAPGSGKGTQCEKIIKELNYYHISTGDLLREEVKAESILGQKAKEYMDKGALVPDELVIGIVKKKMSDPDVSKRGWVLDGFPRTEVQAKALQEAGCVPDKIVLLEVPDEVLEERVCGRRMDPITGYIYHIKYKPPPEDVKDRLIHRKDDTAEALKQRLVMYHNNIDHVLGFYKGSVPVVVIDGIRKPDEVFEDVKKNLTKASSL